MAEQLRAFPGLHYFEDNALDRALFFGRETEIKQLAERIIAEDLTVLFGKSGDGKTSLINAGLKPALREAGYLPVRGRIFNVPAAKTPLAALYEVITEEANAHGLTLPANWQRETLWESFLALRPTPENGLKPIVLVLDQFEELFTLMAGRPQAQENFIAQFADLVRGRLPESVREKYRAQLAALAPQSEEARQLEQLLYGSSAPALRILLSLREDYLAFLNNLGQRIPKVFASRYRLSSLTIDQARAAIAQPPEQDVLGEKKFRIEEDAIAALLKFLTVQSSRSGVNEEIVGPPQLQVLCQQLEAQMRQRGKSRISVNDLGGETGMRQLLSRYYRGILEKFPRLRLGPGPRRLIGMGGILRRLQPAHSPRLAVRRLCEDRLITAGGNRNSRHEDEILREIGVAPADLQQLVESRLLRREPRLQESFYELSHDSLVPSLQTAGGLRQAWMTSLKLVAIFALVFSFFKLGLPYVQSYYEMNSLYQAFAAAKMDESKVASFRDRLEQARPIVPAKKFAALKKEFEDWRLDTLQTAFLQSSNLYRADTLLKKIVDEYPRQTDLISTLADTLSRRQIRLIAKRYRRLVTRNAVSADTLALANDLVDSAFVAFKADVGIAKLKEELELKLGNTKKAQVFADQITGELIKNQEVSKLSVALADKNAMFRLRREPRQNLTEEDVQRMIKQYGFYCSGTWPWSNPEGKGLENYFTTPHAGETVLDGATGLLWQRSGSPVPMTFTEAQKYIAELNRQKFVGYNDWRLPTLDEAMSIVEPAGKRDLYIDAKFNAKQLLIWISDHYSAELVWVVDFSFGGCRLLVPGDYFVRAVR